MGVEMELKVVKKDLQFASANSNTKVVEMVSPTPPYAPPAKSKHSDDILGERMLWKPKEARILKNFIDQPV